MTVTPPRRSTLWIALLLAFASWLPVPGSAVGSDKSPARRAASTTSAVEPSIFRRVAVLLINFRQPDPALYPPPPEPWTRAHVRDVYFDGGRSVAAYYSELSNGAIAVRGDIFGYFTLSTSPYRCESVKWGEMARAAATAAGVDLGQYTSIVYAFPHQPSCWWSAYARGRRDNWINGELSLYTASHELGHSFGLSHASALTCRGATGRVSYSSDCTLDEYGDPFDMMGFSGPRHVGSWNRVRLGLLNADEIETVTADGTFHLAPVTVAGGSPRVLRVARPSGHYYYLELRQPYGKFDDFPALSPAVNGLTIRIAPASGVASSKLIDATPQTISFSDAPLPVGETFVDRVNRINITLLSIDGGGAEVAVDMNADPPAPQPPPANGPDTTPPSTPADLTAFVNAPRVATLSWSAATDDVGVDHYDVYRNGKYFAVTRETEITTVRALEGQAFQFSVSAVDAAGNASDTAVLRFAVPDVTPPGQVFGMTAESTSPTSARLTWLAARDGVRVVGYVVRRGDEVIARLPASARSYTDDSAPADSTVIYAVSAIDAAGNLGPPGLARVRLHDVDAVPPSTPADLQGSAIGGRRVSLSWTASTDNSAEAIRYRVFRGKRRIATVTNTTFVDRPAEARTYRYRVRAVDAAGNLSPFSAPVYVFARSGA